MLITLRHQCVVSVYFGTTNSQREMLTRSDLPLLITIRGEGVQFSIIKADLSFLGDPENRLNQIKLKWQDILKIAFTTFMNFGNCFVH